MSETAKLGLPLIAAAQAQKHVTHNEALVALDTLVQLSALDKDLSAPPADPGEGDTYIVGPGATGAWAGQETNIARFQDGGWVFYTPNEGWLAWLTDEDRLYRHDGAAWAFAAVGDVVGPGSAVDGRPALFDGTSGKLLKQHAAALGAAAAQAYETGSFTPTFTANTPGDLSVGYAEQSGVYVRVGRLVWFRALVTLTPTHSTASGSALFGGLPLPMASFEDLSGIVTRISGSSLSWPSGVEQLDVSGWAGTQWRLRGLRSAGTFSSIQITDYASGAEITLSMAGTYRTT